MPTPDDSSQGDIRRLDQKLDAFQAARGRGPALLGGQGEAGEGYRLLGQMLGGVLGGAGLGWGIDHFAHTAPWGVVVGLVAGCALSIWAVVRTALLISDRAADRAAGPKPPAAPAVEEDET